MIIRRADVTIQSIRAARAYVNTRGTGEPLTDAIAALIEAVADGHTVTVDIRSDVRSAGRPAGRLEGALEMRYACSECGMETDTDDLSVIGRNCPASDFEHAHIMVEDEDQEYRKYCRGAYQLMGDYLRLRTTG